MTYDKTVRTKMTIERVTTVHIDKIDWKGYDFGESVPGDCVVLQQQGYLRICEQFHIHKVVASHYSGWPRIWLPVLGVGMVSKWPYWYPRPCVCLEGTLGAEWIDWISLTGAIATPHD